MSGSGTEWNSYNFLINISPTNTKLSSCINLSGGDSEVVRVDFTDIKQIFDELSVAFFTKFTEEQKAQEHVQLAKIEDLMKEWTVNITNSTQGLIKETLLNPPDTDLSNALAEAQERRTKVVQVF